MQRYLNLGSKESISASQMQLIFSEAQFDPTSDGQKGQKVVALQVRDAGCAAARLQATDRELPLRPKPSTSGSINCPKGLGDRAGFDE